MARRPPLPFAMAGFRSEKDATDIFGGDDFGRVEPYTTRIGRVASMFRDQKMPRKKEEDLVLSLEPAMAVAMCAFFPTWLEKYCKSPPFSARYRRRWFITVEVKDPNEEEGVRPLRWSLMRTRTLAEVQQLYAGRKHAGHENKFTLSIEGIDTNRVTAASQSVLDGFAAAGAETIDTFGKPMLTFRASEWQTADTLRHWFADGSTIDVSD